MTSETANHTVGGRERPSTGGGGGHGRVGARFDGQRRPDTVLERPFGLFESIDTFACGRDGPGADREAAAADLRGR